MDLPELPNDIWTEIIKQSYETPLKKISQLSYYEANQSLQLLKNIVLNKRNELILDLKRHKDSVIEITQRTFKYPYDKASFNTITGKLCVVRESSYKLSELVYDPKRINYYGGWKKINENKCCCYDADLSTIISWKVLYDTKAEVLNRYKTSYDIDDVVYIVDKWSYDSREGKVSAIYGSGYNIDYIFDADTIDDENNKVVKYLYGVKKDRILKFKEDK